MLCIHVFVLMSCKAPSYDNDNDNENDFYFQQ